MEKQLPKNWIEGHLYDLTEPVKTGVKLYKGEKAYYSTGSIKEKGLTIEGFYSFEEKPSRANREVQVNDVLQARMSDTEKALVINEEIKDSLFSTGFMQLRVYENTIIPKYIFYYLKSDNFNIQKNELASGTTQVAINDLNAKKIILPLPPYSEQNRIVTKLDMLFNQLDKIKVNMKNIPNLLDNFKKQVLSLAVSGKLLDIDKFTELGNLGIDIKTGPFGSSLHKSDYVENGIPVINPSHINNGLIVPDLNVSISNDKFQTLKAYELINNDVILGRRGEMGRAALYKEDYGQLLCGTGSIILRCGSNLYPEFLAYYLRSPFCVEYLKANSVGSTMINLNQKIIKSLRFPAISYYEQREIVNRIESLFAKADIIDQQYNSLKVKVDNLPQAILHKAFKGELIEQLESDGDAKDLLMKIKELKNHTNLNKKKV